jgi:predicted anti-sigma-YlaC factor YlaD
MKYLDGEINIEEEKLLNEHLKLCKECRLEFAALKDTYSMLENVELEEPPDNVEQAVLSQIEREDAARNRIKAWRIGALVLAGILAALAGLIYLFSFTPFVSIMIDNTKNLLFISSGAVRYLERVLYTALAAGAKFLTVGRALSIVQRALIETYSTLIIVMVLSFMIILKFYNHIFKFSRR